MLTPGEIKRFIDTDMASERKRLAMIGQRYYEAEHDIRNKRIFFVNADGELEEDKLKSNFRISHPFFTELTDQVVYYIFSSPKPFIRSDNAALQKILNERFNDNKRFKAELLKVVTGGIVKGFEYMYAHKDKNGKTIFEHADSLGVVKCRAKETEDKCEYVIHWYIDSINKENKAIKRIEVWDEKQTYYYCQVDEGEIVLDDTEKINPRPHTLYTNGKDNKIYYDGFGFIPFIVFENNSKQQSGLKPIKPMIDNYDIMCCGLANNIEDTNEALYVVKGFEGDNLDELMQNIKAKKHIGVDENGGVEIQTVNIPVEARKAQMEIDENNIYRFGFGLNTYGLKDTNATTNIAIKSAYSLLDLRANKVETQTELFMLQVVEVVLDEVNKADGTDYKIEDVYFDFKREVPTNAQENAQIELLEAQKRQTEINTILNLAAQLDNETAMKLICEQLDIDYMEIKDKLPKQEEPDPYATQTALDAIQVEG